MKTNVKNCLDLFHKQSTWGKNWKCEAAKEERRTWNVIYNNLTPEEKNELKEIRRQEIAEYLKNLPPLKSEQLILDEEDIKNYY